MTAAITVPRRGYAAALDDAHSGLDLARADRDASRYQSALALLAELARVQGVSRQALTESADIRWMLHDYDGALRDAIEALGIDPVNRRAEMIRDRCRLELSGTRPVDAGTGPSVVHAALYVTPRGNFGDQVLPSAVRAAVEHVAPVGRWSNLHVHQLVDEERLAQINHADALVVGGGGLFLPDTNPNGNSGWQWNIPTDVLRRVDVPLAVVAVGYNLFRGQSLDNPLFRSSLTALAEVSALLGMRNHGSIERVRELLPASLQDRVTYVPCPTTIHDAIAPPRQPATDPARSGTVLLNAAFDRAERRFGQQYGTFLSQIANVVRSLRSDGADVRLAAHVASDEQLAEDLSSEHGVRVRIEALYDMQIEDARDIYRGASVAIGMRGHATMIPFGVGTPVLSIVSHPKMRYFLDDIGRPEWGVDVDDPNLGALLTEKSRAVLAAPEEHRADVRQIRATLLAITEEALGSFGSAHLSR